MALISAFKHALSDSFSYSLIKFQEASVVFLLLSVTTSDSFLGIKKPSPYQLKTAILYPKLSPLLSLMAGGVHSRPSRGLCGPIHPHST